MRTATPEDLELLPSIEEAADRMFEMELPPVADVATLANALVVFVEGDPPVGFARLEEFEGGAHLEQLSVHPDHGRQGVGGALLEAACEWAALRGYPAITLMTFADVPWNAPFYAKHGFVEFEGWEELRKHEELLGLPAIGRRIAMRRPLTTGSYSSTLELQFDRNPRERPEL